MIYFILSYNYVYNIFINTHTLINDAYSAYSYHKNYIQEKLQLLFL